MTFRRNAGDVEQGDRTEARQRCAEMLELVWARHLLDADDSRHLRIIAGQAADHAAKRAPIIELVRHP